MSKIEQQIETLFILHSTELVALVQQLRRFLILKTQPNIELVFNSNNSVNIGYGFTEKAWDCYCGIITYSKHVNISFPSGVALKDPEKVLQGSGSRVRHIRINKLDDIKKPEVIDLLNQARENAWKLTANKNYKENAPETIIKLRSTRRK